jgi:hypothetical protein
LPGIGIEYLRQGLIGKDDAAIAVDDGGPFSKRVEHGAHTLGDDLRGIQHLQRAFHEQHEPEQARRRDEQEQRQELIV